MGFKTGTRTGISDDTLLKPLKWEERASDLKTGIWLHQFWRPQHTFPLPPTLSAIPLRRSKPSHPPCLRYRGSPAPDLQSNSQTIYWILKSDLWIAQELAKIKTRISPGWILTSSQALKFGPSTWENNPLLDITRVIIIIKKSLNKRKSFILFREWVQRYLSGGLQTTQKPARIFVHFSTGLFFFSCPIHQISGPHSALLYTRFVTRQDLALCNCAVVHPAKHCLPSGAQSPQQVYSPCAWVCARYHRHHRHNHKHLLHKQLGSNPIPTAPILPCYTQQ